MMLDYKKAINEYAILFKKDEEMVIALGDPKDDNFAYILAERIIKERPDIINYMKDKYIRDIYGTLATDIQEAARHI